MMSARKVIGVACALPRLRRMIALAIAVALLPCVASGPAVAHEFWLEPSDYQTQRGKELSITLRNGQFFKGNSLPYIRQWFQKFVVSEAGSAKPRDVKSTEGDDPAARVRFGSAGLAISAYISTPDKLNFATREKFESYIKSEGLDRSVAQFASWRRDETTISESYIRCAKTLITVAGRAGRDRLLGLPLEIVAGRDPFKLPAGAPLPVQIFYNGKPMPGLMIKVFAQAAPKMAQRLRTDKDGRAMIPLPKSGAYLLNAVHMLDPPGEPETVSNSFWDYLLNALHLRDPPPAPKPEWKSYWASLTFFRP